MAIASPNDVGGIPSAAHGGVAAMVVAPWRVACQLGRTEADPPPPIFRVFYLFGSKGLQFHRQYCP
eukprot:COSAG06_NODE_296_length_18097_cov_302.227081_15_plen_66_part_00